MELPRCVVVILTFNSASIIRETVAQAKKVSPHVFVVDSYSSDGTPAILEELGCTVVQRPFSQLQRPAQLGDRPDRGPPTPGSCTWMPTRCSTTRSVAEINALLAGTPRIRRLPDPPARLLHGQDAALQRRQPLAPAAVPLGRGPLRSRACTTSTSSAARQPGRLDGFMHDKNSAAADRLDRAATTAGATPRRRKSSGRAVAGDNVLQPRLMGDARERTRFIKELYYKLPTGMRVAQLLRLPLRLPAWLPRWHHGFYFAFFQACGFACWSTRRCTSSAASDLELIPSHGVISRMRQYNASKRILVTGGAGFLGSHLCDRLSSRATTCCASTTSSPAPSATSRTCSATRASS